MKAPITTFTLITITISTLLGACVAETAPPSAALSMDETEREALRDLGVDARVEDDGTVTFFDPSGARAGEVRLLGEATVFGTLDDIEGILELRANEARISCNDGFDARLGRAGEGATWGELEPPVSAPSEGCRKLVRALQILSGSEVAPSRIDDVGATTEALSLECNDVSSWSLFGGCADCISNINGPCKEGAGCYVRDCDEGRVWTTCVMTICQDGPAPNTGGES